VDHEQKAQAVHSSEFKAKVALAALSGEETVAQSAARYQIHPTLVTAWRRTLLEGASEVFDKGSGSRSANEPSSDELYRQIGQLKKSVVIKI
jgi:transposase